MPPMRLAIALSFLCAVVAGVPCAAAPVPIYHGILSVKRASGTLDRTTYTATVRVPEWTALLTPDTDGMFPASEDLMVSIGANDDFTLPAGALKPSRSGRKFVYRAPRNGDFRGLRFFKLWLRRDGSSYGIKFKLMGVANLTRLDTEAPICLPVAVIVGNDDFFSGVSFTSPNFESKKLQITTSCDPGDDGWPWL
jgi:hypothetical protein